MANPFFNGKIPDILKMSKPPGLKSLDQWLRWSLEIWCWMLAPPVGTWHAGSMNLGLVLGQGEILGVFEFGNLFWLFSNYSVFFTINTFLFPVFFCWCQASTIMDDYAFDPRM